MQTEEQILLTSAVGYARVNSISLTKIAWALSSLLQKPENAIYHKLKEIDLDFDPTLFDIFGVPVTDYDKIPYEEDIEDDYLESKVGEIVIVEVLEVKTFGVICKVENTTRTLLLHLSEIANEFINDVSKFFKKGDKIQAMLIINPKGELGLSTRKLKPKNQTNEGDDS